jgi:hypothetical protein
MRGAGPPREGVWLRAGRGWGYIDAMRTLITLLLLACFAVTQASAAGCPMASAPHGQAEDGHASASTHHGHHAPAPAPAERHEDERHPPSPVHHAAAGCVLMACGSTAAPPAAPTLAVRDAARPDGTAPGRGFYASPSLATDPPPPRIALRS